MGAQFLNQHEQWNGEHSALIVNKTDQTGRKTIINPPEDWQIYITNWQGVIDSRTFLLCQERLSQNIQIRKDNKPTGAFQELAGLVKCGQCGRAVKIKGKYGSMSCIGRSELRGVCDISFRGVRLPKIQEQVNIAMQEYLDNFIKNQREWMKIKEDYRRQIRKLESEIENLVNAIAEQPALSKTFSKGIEAREQQLSELRYKLQMSISPRDKIEYRILKDLNKANKGPRIDSIEHILYDNLNAEQKQVILKIVINKILLNSDGTIKIIYN